METAGLLSLVGLVALMVLTLLADVAAKITTQKAGTPAADHSAGTSNMIEVGDAQFTAAEYARLVQLHLAYHSTPTTGGDER